MQLVNAPVRRRARRTGFSGSRDILRRLAVVAAAFALAFAVDVATGRAYSSVWGGAAIVVSPLALLPSLRGLAAPVGVYAAVWLGFGLARAVADDAGLAVGSLDLVARVEAAIFGGVLPTRALQDWLHAPGGAIWLDGAMAAIHLSFFVAPTAAAIVLLRWDRSLFRRYVTALAVVFALGTISFALLPTAPPWLTEPSVTRVSHTLVADAGVDSAGGAGQGFGFEPNHVASMPSIHLAATALLIPIAARFGRVVRMAAWAYAAAMAFALVYLGEHYVLDVAAGGVTAGAAWWVTGKPAPRRSLWLAGAGNSQVRRRVTPRRPRVSA